MTGEAEGVAAAQAVVSPPIVVNPSATADQLKSQVGPLVGAISGVALAFGLLSPVKVAALGALAPYVVVAVWQLWRSTHRHAERVVMANAAPNDVAQVKGSAT